MQESMNTKMEVFLLNKRPTRLDNKKQQSETTQHIALPTERRKRILNPKEDFGVIFTKEEIEDEAQYESEIIDDTTVFTI